MAIGSRGFLGIGKETNWGTEAVASKYLPIVSESLSTNIEQIVSAAQKAVVDEPKSYAGLVTHAGDISLEVHPVSIGDILRSALNAPASAIYETGPLAYKHEFTPRQDDFATDCALCPYTIEIYRDQGNSFQYKGAVVNTLDFSFGTGEKILKATAGIIAKELASITKTIPSFETEDPFTWEQAVIKIATVQNNDLESFSIKLDNHLAGIPTLNNTNIISRVYRDGARTVDVSAVFDFVDQTQFDIFTAQTEQAFEITLTGAEIETGHNYSLIIEMPKVRYTAFPINIGGAGRITCSVTGKAKYDASNGYAVKVTLINKETEY